MKIPSAPLASLFAMAVATGVVSACANAQTADHGKITTVSRSVMMFSQLEQSLDAAITGNDRAAQEKLLSADFELRLGSSPGVPVARAEWLAGHKPSANTELSQMAVHDDGNLAVASFLRSTPSNQPDQPTQLTFVVDVWKKQGNDWQLDTRYESNAGASNATEQDIAPNGKG